MQLSTEVRKHYRNGAIELCKKISALKKKNVLPIDTTDRIDPKISAVENFLLLNRICGNGRPLAPLSSFETLFVTLSERDLTCLFWQDILLRRQLQIYAFPDFPSMESPGSVTQTDVHYWLSRVEPGTLINRFLTDIEGYSEGQRRKKKDLSRSTRRMSIEDMREHVRPFRQNLFEPETYSTKGYVLRGSVRTDGFRLQALAFKMNELNAIKYRRLSPEKLPPRITSTLGGADYFLAEIRNVVARKKDVQELWGCDPEQIKVLGIDLGQAFVGGASAILPSSLQPGTKHGLVPIISGTSEDQVPLTKPTKFYNLAVNQKAVYQPTFKHRRWLERRKGKAIEGKESITTIETNLPPRRGPEGSMLAYAKKELEVGSELEAFYNNVVLKKHKWNARKARQQEFRIIADRLLGLVGGSLGRRRDDNDKVVIGIGLGRFSSKMRLSSLHSTFEAFFVQKARSLGYIVVGVNEFYTSKRCPLCEDFVGQVEIRRLYCSWCQAFMHRDVMAGQNICNAIRGHLLRQQRPRYLQPRDEQNNYPWEKTQHAATTALISSPTTTTPGPMTTTPRLGGVKRRAPSLWTESNETKRVAE